MNTTICSAIDSKRIIRFYYDGGLRIVEPFCYGLSKKDSKELLRGYQVSGYSKSGDTVGWKLFRVSEMSSLTMIDEQFSGVRPGYNPNDSAMTTIYAHI
jgi:hypothetical protein